MQQRFRLPSEIPQALLGLATVSNDPFHVAVALQQVKGAPLAPGPAVTDRVQTVRAAVLCPLVLEEADSWLLMLPQGEHFLRGAVLCRTRRYPEALGELKGLEDPLALLFTALAEQGKGKKEAARDTLTTARKRLAAEPRSLPWKERVEIETLRREVEALVGAN